MFQVELLAVLISSEMFWIGVALVIGATVLWQEYFG